MVSNFSVHDLRPLDPSVDPAYRDGPPPRPHPTQHVGELAIDWPFPVIPEPLRRFTTISIEELENEIEREAEFEETKF